MKQYSWMLVAVMIAAPLTAQASCETVKAEINQKIINNGVSANAFTLDIVPNDRVEGGQVVGHCANDTQKIVYQRNGADNESVPASTGSSQDAPAS